MHLSLIEIDSGFIQFLQYKIVHAKKKLFTLEQNITQLQFVCRSRYW